MIRVVPSAIAPASHSPRSCSASGTRAPSARLAPPLRHVAPEVQDASGVRAWFETFSGPVDYEVRDLTVTASDDIAFCHSLNRMSAVPHGGERFDLWYRGTVGLQRLDGAWRITHEHTSTPFYMDGSFGAALDLAP